MRYLLKEMMYVIGAFCSMYAIAYPYINEDWQCKAWGGFGAFLASYIAYKISKAIFKRKNLELKDMAGRKKELEIALFGENRLSSGYEPDDHV
jgi:hypothetical protein